MKEKSLVIGAPVSAKFNFSWCPPGKIIHNALEFTIERGFWMSSTTVTNEQWEIVMGDSHLRSLNSDMPIFRIDYSELVTFLDRINQFLKNSESNKLIKLELPNIIEMKYATKANTESKWFWGDRLDEILNYAWVKENSDNRVHEVGRKKPNRWGLYDMYGNVLQMCYDVLPSERGIISSKSDIDLFSNVIPVFGGYFGDESKTFLDEGLGFIDLANSYAEDVGFRLILREPE
jgi:hypothetical protein